MNEKSTSERIFEKLDLLGKDVSTANRKLDVVQEQMKHKPDKVEMIEYVDQKMKLHKEDCSPQGEPSQVVDMTQYRQSDRTTTSDAIRISIKGLPPIARYLIYLLLAGGLFTGGHFAPSVLGGHNEKPIATDKE